MDLGKGIVLDESELAFDFARAGGPGGQKVNKTSSAVVLRFDVRSSPSLSDEVKERLERLGGRRVTPDGILVIHARRFRSQAANRNDAVQRLLKLLTRAMEEPVERRPTRRTHSSVERRLSDKKHRSELKRGRSAPPPVEDPD